MHKNQIKALPHQQKLAFAADEVWQKLPSDACERCRTQIAQLLERSIHNERQTRRENDERQDQR